MTTRTARLLAKLALAVAAAGASFVHAQDSAQPRVWEINGIRLEADQVERLASDMAERTVAAVIENVPGIELEDAQRAQMLAIYRDVSLDVYASIVDVVNTPDLDDDTKEERVRELTLAGCERSHALLEPVLRQEQLALYTTWEQAQIEAYENNRSDGRRRGRRRR